MAYDIPIFRKDFRENDRPVNLNMWLITVKWEEMDSADLVLL